MRHNSATAEIAAVPADGVAVWREFDAARINAIINNPHVRPWVADVAEGVLDITAQVRAPGNILLMGQHGGCLLFNVMPGVFEIHSQCLPEGRGEWMRQFIQGVFQWMFTQSNCWEIVTRVPRGHLAARALTRMSGLTLEFTRDDQCLFRGRQVPVDIYRISIHDWVEKSDWALRLGEVFHHQLNAEAARLGIPEQPHEDDPQHNRIVGVAIEMARKGQALKAGLFYNRWAYLARHRLVELVCQDPPVFRMDIGLLQVRPNDIRVKK